ncbi:MAG: TonB-dependent receptor domain-containing protein, partial [Terriglobales bacterium]
MKRTWLLFMLVILGGMLFLSNGTARAQEATGKIVGTVFDQQGAVIPGAQVTVTNTATGVTSTSVTNNEGYFEVPNIPIGTYNVTVEHNGFEKTVTQEKKLEINQSLKFSITMKVGATSESVTVEAQVSGVETENPTLGQTVTSNVVGNTPLNGRNVLDLALLQPGVTGLTSNAGGTMDFNVGGGRADSITYLLDGGLNNDLLDNGVVFNPNPDTIAEFRILTNNYTAEYGRNGAGIITIVTKSGTNNLHGSAFDFLRNDAFNANTFFNNLNQIPRDNLKRNQFGGTIGGPITVPHVVHGHDKLFFFIGYQGQRQTDAQTSNQVTTFTPAEANGNFSQAINNGPDPSVAAFLQANPFFQADPAKQAQAIIDPTKINVVAANVFAAKFIPLSPTGLVTSVGSAQDNNNELTGKVDYAISSKDKLGFTIGGERRSRLLPFAHASVSGFPDITTEHSYFAGISYVRTFSANLLNEFHFTAQRSNTLQDTPGVNLPGDSQLGFGITPDKPTGPPEMDFDNGLLLGFSIQGPSNLVGNTYAYTDAATWIKGRNTWKFGGGFSAYQQNMVFDFQGNGQFFFDNNGGAGTGNSFADFFLGIPDSFAQSPNAPSNIRSKLTYGFAQDEWRVKNNLTLTLGVRYEYSSPKRDTFGRTFSIIPGLQSTRFVNAPLGLVFPGDAQVPLGSNFPDKDNFAPRLGVAWDVTGKGTTVVRAGGSIVYLSDFPIG